MKLGAIPLALASIVALACGSSGPVELTVTATPTCGDDGQCTASVEATTEPGALVTVSDMNGGSRVGHEEWGPAQGTADADGHFSGTLHATVVGSGIRLTALASIPSAHRQSRTVLVTGTVPPALLEMGDCRALSCSVTLQASTSSVAASGPEGSRLEILGTTTVLHPTVALVPVDVTPLLGAVAAVGILPAGAPGHVDRRGTEAPFLGVPARLTLADGTVLSTTLRWDTHLPALAGDVFLHVTEGPVSMTPEGTGHGILVLDPHGRDAHLVGAPATLGDVTRVAIVEARTHGGTCGNYRSAGGDGHHVAVVATDQQVDVYERRTGAHVGGRLFRAPPADCPEVVYGTHSVSSTVDLEERDAWLATLDVP